MNTTESTTESFWVYSVETPHLAMQFVDVRPINTADSSSTWAARVRVADSILWIPTDESFAERYDVVRRVSAPKPDGADAYPLIITFVNHDFVTPGGRAPRQEVEVWAYEPLDDDADLTDLGYEAAELLPELGWGDERETGWWASTVKFPSGRVVDFGGNEVA